MPDVRQYAYRVVDVFTQQPLEGNALAVFTNPEGLDHATMQKIAKEMNLAETTFVLPPTRLNCVARVRIFTPTQEMVFAGHPTIGTSFVLLDEGVVPQRTTHFALDEKVGPVQIRVEGGERPLIWLTTPPIEWGRLYDRELCARSLGLGPDDLLDIAPQALSAGNPTIYIGAKSKEIVDRAWLDSTGLRLLKNSAGPPLCVFVFAATPEGAYSRMFAPEHGIAEDPATGSSTGPLAAYMMRHKLAPDTDGTRFRSEQGAKMGRRSILYVQIYGEQGDKAIDVGGYVTPLVRASMDL